MIKGKEGNLYDKGKRREPVVKVNSAVSILVMDMCAI
jgi:hypothetical protein